jgi:hypothetical protein
MTRRRAPSPDSPGRAAYSWAVTLAMTSARHLLLSALLVGALAARAEAQSAPVKYLSVASDNATLVRAGKTLVNTLLPVNTTTTIYYLKLYNKATQPVCGTDVPLWTIPVPYGASNSGGGVALPAGGLMFPLGLGFCLTGGIADTDDTSAAAGVAINFGISGSAVAP